VDGVRRRDLHVLSWEIVEPPVFGRVAMACHATASGQAPRIEDIGDFPPIGAAVWVRPAEDSAGEDFHGAVTGHRLEIGETGEGLVVEAEHQLARDLAGVITTRRQRSGDDMVEVAHATVCFNVDGAAGADTVWIGGRETRVFDTSASAIPWTVTDTLAYLLATQVPADVECPDRQELASLASDIDLGVLDVTSLTAAEALMRVAGRGGLALRAARSGKGLVFYRPGHGGRLRTVSLQPAGQALSTAETNLWRGTISIRPRPTRRAVLALGDHKRYESTFLAVVGWDPSLETSRWRDFVRSESSDWELLSDVFRKWVLNEHDWYGQSPWNLPAFDFSSISAEDFVLKAPRKFLPCLSTHPTGASLGIVVEYRCDTDSPWRRWRGPLWVSQDEAAVYLGGDALPGEYFHAAVAETVQLRITASLLADARLTFQTDESPAWPPDVVDLSSRAKWSDVHSSSVFHDRTDLGAPAERDDTCLLQEFAARAAEVSSETLEAELTLGWVDTSFQPGDIIERIEGRAVELPSRDGQRPWIRSIRHDFGDDPCTRLLITG
jgi:hypothetical protein